MQNIVAVLLCQGMVELQPQNNILIDRTPFEQMISLKHVADLHDIGRFTIRNAIIFVEQTAFLRYKQSGDDRQKRGFADGSILETFDNGLVITVKIFKGMDSVPVFDMDKICDRLRHSLCKNGISYQKAARDMKVSRDLVFDYTNPNYPEKSMQVKTLIKFADYLGLDKYYFCNEYHRFINTVDVGAFLLELRKKNEMTQKQFAAYLDIPYYRYKTYESGRCKLPQEVFDKLKMKKEFT